MDVLTLPEEGWALAYPSPHYDVAHLVHVPCGWRSEGRMAPESAWLQAKLMDEHDCVLTVLVDRWCPRCGKPFTVERHAAPHLLCNTCSATNPDRRVRDRFRALMGRR